MRRLRAAVAVLGCGGGLLVVPVGAVAGVEEQPVLVVANVSSLSDVGTAASLVAGGVGDAVVFAAGRDRLGVVAAEVVTAADPRRVVLVGGVAVLGDEVASEVKRLAPHAVLERLAGEDRVHTAALAARAVLGPRLGSGSLSVAIANGWSLSDVATAASAVIRTPSMKKASHDSQSPLRRTSFRSS